MQIKLQVFTEKYNTSRHYMWRFITGLSAVLNTEWTEQKIKTMPHSAKSISIIDMIETRTILKNNYPKLKNNKPRPKFTSLK